MAARAIWSGTISFGLVNIPVKLFTAIRANEQIHFHLMHDKDEGRIQNIRRCSKCGKEVPWEHVVKAWEYEKGEYVVADDDEVKKLQPEATQSIDIIEFVDETEIDPRLYETPYFAVPEKNGKHAYALLRDVLNKSGKVGIAKVVLRTKQYLAAVKPIEDALVLGLMHFAEEMVDPKTLTLPPKNEKATASELKVAMMLVDTMTAKFEPKDFKDRYQKELRAMLVARAENKVPAPKRETKAKTSSSKVIDLAEVLKRSLDATKKHRGAAKKAS